MSEAYARWAAVVTEAYAGTRPLDATEVRGAVDGTIAELDSGRLQVAEKQGDQWVTHGWLQQAISLYFRLRAPVTLEETSMRPACAWCRRVWRATAASSSRA